MTLAAHPWLAQSWVSTQGHVLRPSHQGRVAWREHGREAWIRKVAPTLTSPWRVLESLAGEPGDSELTALLQSPRPRLPLVLDEARDGNTVSLHLRVPLELVHFDGHFPGAPVIPGVLQIGWALELAASRLGTATACGHIENLKFQHLLRPGDIAELILRHDADTLHFRCRDGTRAYASGRLRVGYGDHD